VLHSRRCRRLRLIEPQPAAEEPGGCFD